MTCQTLREAIVDIARGADAGQGTRAAVECHVEHCRACAALLAREHQLSLGLRALAASTSSDGASDAMGRRLREMFAERQTAGVGGGVATEPRRFAMTFGRAAWAAAAALVIVAGSAARWGSVGKPPAPVGPEPTPQASAEPPAVPGPQPTSLQPTPPAPVVRAVKRPRAAPPVRYAVATGFVALPNAVGLPDFESGQIIRMEIPVTSLPTYGIEILPDARDRQVEADLLVGQDGQARAIRLVSDAGGRR